MIPRSEFPNPIFTRTDWVSLNGTWEFEFDHGRSGSQRGWKDAAGFSRRITVPFCFESPLSGIGEKDFCECVWYRRTVEIPAEKLNGSVILRFGAVDYKAQVWVNGQCAGHHVGGMSSFSFDITPYCAAGANTVIVEVNDELRSGLQPSGKQSGGYYSAGCHYTRTTGIWQSVWLEFIPAKAYIRSFKVTPDILNQKAVIEAVTSAPVAGAALEVSANYEGRPMGRASARLDGENIRLELPLSELYLWEPGAGRLYDLTLSYNGDTVTSYFGMRSVEIHGYKIKINGKTVFQRLVLDQGFYPDGIWTAPTDDALRGDIELSMAVGFNGARLHQKIFEPRFLYHADRLGYLVWGEHGNWGIDYRNPQSYLNFAAEWTQTLERDYSHPSIIGWCPFNETNHTQNDEALYSLYTLTKQLDPTRPCIDTSGYDHVITDVFDVHDYDQNPESFKARYDAMLAGDFFQNTCRFVPQAKKVSEMPYFVSEYGGTWWNPASATSTSHTQSWGYGKAPEGMEEFYARFKGLADALLDNPRICALCYTQLTDVEQEQNGVYCYDRKPKFDSARLRAALARKAAIENDD